MIYFFRIKTFYSNAPAEEIYKNKKIVIINLLFVIKMNHYFNILLNAYFCF